MIRSTLSRPVALSNSYFTFEPSGISMRARKSRGNSSPGETSCHGCIRTVVLAVDNLPVYYHLRPDCFGNDCLPSARRACPDLGREVGHSARCVSRTLLLLPPS